MVIFWMLIAVAITFYIWARFHEVEEQPQSNIISSTSSDSSCDKLDSRNSENKQRFDVELAKSHFSERHVILTGFDFVVIDLETTGLDALKHEIIELGAARYRDGKCVATYEQLIQPRYVIPEYITELTGIANGDVAGKPIIQQKIFEFMRFIGDDVIVGHNVYFDIRFLKPHVGWIPNTIIDTLKLARNQCPSLLNYKLDTVARHIGYLADGDHRALADVKKTAACYLALATSPPKKEVTSRMCSEQGKSSYHQPPKLEITPNAYFVKKVFAFSGKVRGMTQVQAWTKVLQGGGDVRDKLSESVDYLVVSGTNVTKKELEAKKMQANGHRIKIISGEQFLQMLNKSRFN